MDTTVDKNLAVKRLPCLRGYKVIVTAHHKSNEWVEFKFTGTRFTGHYDIAYTTHFKYHTYVTFVFQDATKFKDYEDVSNYILNNLKVNVITN